MKNMFDEKCVNERRENQLSNQMINRPPSMFDAP